MAFAQAIKVRRMIEGIALEPKQTFWIMTVNLLADSAAIEWSKVFGSWDEDTHWTRIVPKTEHERVRAALLRELGLSRDEWTTYREEIVQYRNEMVAHHTSTPRSQNTRSTTKHLLQRTSCSMS